MQIPTQMSGRLVSNRGVHGPPTGQSTGWMKNAGYWIDLLQSMGMSWFVALSDSDAFYKSGAAKALLDGGVIPITRFAYNFPHHFNEMVAVEQLSNLCAKYGAPCIIQFANEPLDPREGEHDWPPPDDEAWPIIAARWREAANIITERGAIAGFPDGPGWDRNPFDIIGDDDLHWAEGRAVYLVHAYGKNRPLDYPEDGVTRYGVPLTWEQYLADLDDYADNMNWNEGPQVLEQMNAQRKSWANPNASVLTDDTCWWAWKKVDWFAQQAFGHSVPMAVTEGGWVPRDRAGSGGSSTDIRWPYTTPKMVAHKTLEIYQEDTPLFAICPWLLACREMDGSGWEDDSWVGGSYSDKYGLKKPVVQALQLHPPGPVQNTAAGEIAKARDLLDEAWRRLKVQT